MPSKYSERRTGRGLLPLLLLLLAGLTVAGCQQRIQPPASVSDPVAVFVIDYGRHASLTLPVGEDEDGLVEWSWGDWNWFARERMALHLVGREAFNSVVSAPEFCRIGADPLAGEPDRFGVAIRH